MFRNLKTLAAAALLAFAASSPASAQADISAGATKPTIVLVHGAFADGSSWQPIIRILQRDGYPVIAVQNPLTSLADDVATTRRVIDAQSGPVVAVGHSYGGAVITGAAAGNERVRALVYVAAFAPDAGEPIGAFGERYPTALGAALRPDAAGFLYMDRAQFHDVFAADLPAAETRLLAAAQKPVAASVFGASVPEAAWRTIPSWYVVAQEDRAINPELERFYAQRANARTTGDPGQPCRLRLPRSAGRARNRRRRERRRPVRRDVNDDPSDPGRRSFIGAAAALAVGQLGFTARPSKAGEPAMPNAGFGPLKQVDAGLLSQAYAEAGPADGPPVILLHGWPYDIYSFVEVAPILARRGFRVIIPYLRGFGPTRFHSAETPRNGQPAALAMDVIALMDALGIRSAILGGFDWGARTADIVAALRPERVNGLVSVSGYLIGSQAQFQRPLPPEAELQWWYQFYFATERGQRGYAANTRDFNRLIWRLTSPRWTFSDEIFARSAASFDNPDHVSIVIHNYRWRLSLAEGEARYDALEQRIGAGPPVAVPTITMEGDANGAPHPDPAAYRAKFTGPYEHRLIEGGIGHNLPQEAPEAFAGAIIDVARMSASRAQ